MNANLNVGVKGKYIFRDPKTKQITREVQNIISDWGMERMSGFRDHKCLAFLENFKMLFMGDRSTILTPDLIAGMENGFTPSPDTHWGYIPGGTVPPPPVGSPNFYVIRHISHPLLAEGVGITANYAAGGKYYWPTNSTSHIPGVTHVNSERPELVGITYDRDPTTDELIIRFANTWRVWFLSTVNIYEIGVGPLPPAYGTGNLYGLSSRPQGSDAGLLRNEAGSPAGIYPYDFLTRLTHQRNANYGIFSRAVLMPDALYNVGDTADITYICEVRLCKDMEYQENFPFNSFGHPGGALPNRKTSLRQCPFFKPTGFMSTNRDEFLKLSITHPIREDYNVNVVGPILDNFHRTYRPYQWVLDLYTEVGATNPYPGFTSTNTLTAEDADDSTSAPIPNPLYSQSINHPITPTLVPPRTKSAFFTQAGSESVTYDAINSIWQRKVEFIFRSDKWADSAISPVYTFSIWRRCNANQQIPYDYKRQAGIHTFLSARYTPPPGKWLKFTLAINFQR